MEQILFFNKVFWEGSGYAVLMALSLMRILLHKEENIRARNMAVYSILVFVFVIYNPAVVPIGMKFFAEDERAYLRIFYLLPLMTIIAYAAADFYADKVDVLDAKSKKFLYALVICAGIVVSGRLYDKSMYQKAENIYKIEEEALIISEAILEDFDGEKARALVPEEENILYGIRQYTGNIIIAGCSDEFTDYESLWTIEEEKEFDYLIIRKERPLVDILETEEYQYLLSTAEYFIYKKAGN